MLSNVKSVLKYMGLTGLVPADITTAFGHGRTRDTIWQKPQDIQFACILSHSSWKMHSSFDIERKKWVKMALFRRDQVLNLGANWQRDLVRI